MDKKLIEKKVMKMAKETGIPLRQICKVLGILEPVSSELAEKISAVNSIEAAKDLFHSLPKYKLYPDMPANYADGCAVLSKLYQLYLDKFSITVNTIANARRISDDVKYRSSKSYGMEQRAIWARWVEIVETPEDAGEVYCEIGVDYPESAIIVKKMAKVYGL